MESREESNVKNVLGRYAFIGQSPFYRGRVTAADNDTALVFANDAQLDPGVPIPPEHYTHRLFQLRGLGERCKLPSGVWGEAPAD